MATLDELKVMIDAEIAPFRKKMKEKSRIRSKEHLTK